MIKKLLTLEVYKGGLDLLNTPTIIRLKLLNRWTLAKWTYFPGGIII